eukprot:scaffold32422_cov40-Phaeocystis_antarctica.AAC.1
MAQRISKPKESLSPSSAAWMVKRRGIGDFGGGQLEHPRWWLGAPWSGVGSVELARAIRRALSRRKSRPRTPPRAPALWQCRAARCCAAEASGGARLVPGGGRKRAW